MPDRHIPESLIPPGVADARSRAFLALLRRGMAEFDFTKLLMRNAGEMPDEVLELAVHDRSLGEYIPPDGVPREIARRFIDASWDMHATQGTEGGIDLGLDLLNMHARIRQWYDENPPAHHDTFEATIFIDDDVYGEGEALTARSRSLAARMFREMQRHSQDGAIRFGMRGAGSVRAGAHVSSQVRARVKAAFTPPTAQRVALGRAVGTRCIVSTRISA